MRTAAADWCVGSDALKAIAYMLRLHDLVERLRNLQPEDVTEEQREQASLRLPLLLRGHEIAAAVRVMVADHFVGANKKGHDDANT